MGIMNFLRERMGKILAIVIGLALFAFIVGEVAKSGSSFMRDSRNEIGEVYGEQLPYDQFSKKVDQNTKNFMQQSGQGNVTPQITSYIQETTWNQLISEVILKKEIDRLGLVVGTDETRSMISGNNPNPQIVQAFGDPKTGQIDRSRLNMFLSNISTTKDTLRTHQWRDFITQMIEAKKAEKYLALVRNGLYVNSLDAKDDYEAKNKLANFKYAVLDYASLPDNKVTLTDDDYQSYYNDHKAQFKNQQETRSFEYVSFNAAPSKDDTLAAKTEIDKLVTDFKNSTNDSLFVQVNAETKAPLIYQHKGQLEPKLDSVMFSASKGTVYGPYFSNGSYKIAKLIDERVGPDSVKASHILLNPATEGGVDKAMAKADSLKKLVQGGKSFAELAKEFSSDKGSAEKGGELGTFGRGSMVPAFEDAAFGGQKGDLKIVTTQFGVHLIQINDQKGSSKVVKVAVVDKPLQASSKTQSEAYAKAQTFLSALTDDNFDAEAKKENLEVKHADDVAGTTATLPGLDNARDAVRWAFKADEGSHSDEVFTSGNQYFVTRMLTIKPQGTLPLATVKKQIENDVRQMVKGKKLSEMFDNALKGGASNIDAVAQKVGVKANPVQNIVFANPVIPGLSPEYKVVGTVFGLPLHKLSAPITGQHGVFIVESDSFINPAPLTNAVREKEQIGQALLQRSDAQVFDALKDKANVKDYRAKFL